MKLLVVEDEALLRHHLQTRLTESGHVVEAVANAEEALYQAEQFNHDLAIVDLGLPGMSGLDLIRQLRSQGLTPLHIEASGAASATKLITPTWLTTVALR